jgi:hypothetical protein
MSRLSNIAISATSSLIILGCNNGDITVETDLGEKYIVKSTAVTAGPFEWETKAKEWEAAVKNGTSSVARIYGGKASCLNLGLGENYCQSSWGGLIKDAEKSLQTAKSNLSEIKRLQGNGEHPIQPVRYRSIFVDVNNERHAMGYVSVTCLNPDLTGEQSKKIFEILELKEDEVKKKTSPKQSACKSVSLQVCKKYAYPKTNRFSFTVDDDQSEDKLTK